MYSNFHNFSFPLKLFLPFSYYQKHVRCFFIRGCWQIMSTQIFTYSVLQTVCHFLYPSFWQLWSIEMGLSLKECECFSLTLVSWTIVWASEPKYFVWFHISPHYEPQYFAWFHISPDCFQTKSAMECKTCIFCTF